MLLLLLLHIAEQQRQSQEVESVSQEIYIKKKLEPYRNAIFVSHSPPRVFCLCILLPFEMIANIFFQLLSSFQQLQFNSTFISKCIRCK